MYRLAGALLLVLGCALVGRLKIASDRRNICIVSEYIRALNILICELEFHRTPLPTLCSLVTEQTTGVISDYFSVLESKLSENVSPDVKTCSALAIQQNHDIPEIVKGLLALMGESLGMFGVEGQIEQLRFVRKNAEDLLEHIQKTFETLGNSRQTLWICAGIALAVIMI